MRDRKCCYRRAPSRPGETTVYCGCQRFMPSNSRTRRICFCEHSSDLHEQPDPPKIETSSSRRSRTVFARVQLDLMETVARELGFKSDPARKTEIESRFSHCNIKYKSFIGWMTRKRNAAAKRPNAARQAKPVTGQGITNRVNGEVVGVAHHPSVPRHLVIKAEEDGVVGGVSHPIVPKNIVIKVEHDENAWIKVEK